MSRYEAGDYSLIVNSFDRTSGTDSDFEITFGGLPQFSEMAMRSVTFTNCVYNVTSDNSTFSFIEDSTDTCVATLSPGNYDTVSMASYLATAMNAATANARTYTITFNSNPTGKTTITASAGTVSILPVNGNLNFMLGYSNTTASTPGLSTTAPNCYSLDRYSNIYIQCEQIVGQLYNTITGTQTNYLDSFPLGSFDFGDVFTFSPRNLVWRKLSFGILRNLRFRLVDESGTQISTNGKYITFEIQLR